MSRRARILTEILGFNGWNVTDAYFEWCDGSRANVAPPLGMRMNAQLVLVVQRRWEARCAQCLAVCKHRHETCQTRRWKDLPWAWHRVWIEATPVRVVCPRCNATPVELLPWAGPHERETHRLQNLMALQAASMPSTHVAALHGVSWSVVRRVEKAALGRWQETRPRVVLRQVGIDEKYLGRRHKREEKWVTIISNNQTGEPVWIGFGRGAQTVQQWLATLSKSDKAQIRLFVMDMSHAFKSAIREDKDLDSVPIVHDPFHLLKRANDAIDEVRRAVFFRAGAEMRGLGRGTRWLLLRAWENTDDNQRERLRYLFRCNSQLARTYQVVEELREVMRAPDRLAMEQGLWRILQRTQRRSNVPLRKLHDSLLAHRDELLALGEHRPATGRVEALNNNWETLIRRSRGCRDLDYVLVKLRFMTVNPIHRERDLERFLALGLRPPLRAPARPRRAVA